MEDSLRLIDNGKPALLGGKVAFKDTVPILRPTLPSYELLGSRFEEAISSGMLTNGRNVQNFERACAEYLGVRNCVAVSSCTAGMMLVERALELKREVIVPSFTFPATVHALAWNGLTPVFVDCEEDTVNIDPGRIEDTITPHTSAIVGVHVFGNPADISALEAIARRRGLRLIFDSAHAFGARHRGNPVGSGGDAEIFSLSPTKLLIAVEGGIVATDDDELARKVRVGRNYGDPGTYDCEFPGLNARMSELHAIIGLEGLNLLEEKITRRNAIAHCYERELGSLPGVRFQTVRPDDRCTYKDFSIIFNPEDFGLGRDEVAAALREENVDTRKYFFPPLHRQRAYAHFYEEYKDKLPSTDRVSNNILSLPIYCDLSDQDVLRICHAIRRIHEHASEIREMLTKRGDLS